MPADLEVYAKAAYQAFHEALNQAALTWEQLPPAEREAWRASADVVLMLHTLP